MRTNNRLQVRWFVAMIIIAAMLVWNVVRGDPLTQLTTRIAPSTAGVSLVPGDLLRLAGRNPGVV